MKLQPGMAAIVTGGGSGIGRAACLFLASHGLRVTVAEYDEAGGRETVRLVVEKTGRENAARFVKCDVSKPAELARAFSFHLAWCGNRMDVAVNNAGIGEKEWFLRDGTTDGSGKWRQVVDVDLTAVIDGTRLAIRAMQSAQQSGLQLSGGAVVNVASAAGLYPSPNGPVYSAAKAGVVMFTRSLAHLAAAGIRVNALCPEFVATGIVSQVTGQAAKHMNKVLTSLGGFISMETIMEGLSDLLTDDCRAGDCLWITNRLGKQWWPTDEEKKRYLAGGEKGAAAAVGKTASSSSSSSSAAAATGAGTSIRLNAMPADSKDSTKDEGQRKLPACAASAGLPPSYRKIVVTRLSSAFRAATATVERPLRVPLPAGKALLRVHYAGVNASDVNFSAGRYAASQEEAARNLPFDAGFESVGTLVAWSDSLPPSSSKWMAVGRPAAAMAYGAFAEYCLVDASRLLPVPAASPQVVAMLTSGLTASIALTESGRMGVGETVLVTAAAGGTGQFAVQLAKLAGNRVVATCGSEAKRRVLMALGADVVVNHREEGDMAEALQRACFPSGASLIYESVGGDLFPACLKAMGRKGRLVLIGMMAQYTAGKEGEWVTRAHPGLCEQLLANSQTLVGFFLLHYPHLWRSHFNKLYSLYKANKLQVSVDPTPFLGLGSVAAAVEHLQSGRSVGKVVVQINPGSGVAASARL